MAFRIDPPGLVSLFGAFKQKLSWDSRIETIENSTMFSFVEDLLSDDEEQNLSNLLDSFESAMDQGETSVKDLSTGNDMIANRCQGNWLVLGILSYPKGEQWNHGEVILTSQHQFPE